MSKLIVHTDGGARGNPGPAAVGFLILDEVGSQLASGGKTIGVATNNEAEYKAVIAALEYLVANKHLINNGDIKQKRELELRMDSLLIASQLEKKYKIKEPRLKELAAACWRLFDQLDIKYHIIHIPRAQNAAADALVNQALDEQAAQN